MIKFLGIRRRDILPEARELQNDVNCLKKALLSGSQQTSSHQLEEKDDFLLRNQLIERLVKECYVQQSLFEKYSGLIIVHEIMQSRIEFMLFLSRYLLEANQVSEFISRKIIAHLAYLFRLVHSIILLMERDNMKGAGKDVHCSLEQENSFRLKEVEDWGETFIHVIRQQIEKLSEQQSNWYTISRTALGITVVDILSKSPYIKDLLGLSMASACSALNASCPEIQLVALGYLAASLKRELLPVFPHDLVDAEGNRQSGVTGELPSNSSASKWEGGGSRGKTSSKKLAKQKALKSSSLTNIHDKKQPVPNQVRDSEELYRNGMLRAITWSLLHENYFIRRLAGETLNLFMAVVDNVPSGKQNLNDVIAESQLWSCCIEQGIVPLLEHIYIGIPVFHSAIKHNSNRVRMEERFPESDLRGIARLFLKRIVSAFEITTGGRNRLTMALTHSGNQKLRMNIFLSLLFVCGRSSLLGSLLFDTEVPPLVIFGQITNGSISTTPGSSGAMTKHFLLQMLQSAANNPDPEEMKRIILFILNLLRLAYSIRKNKCGQEKVYIKQGLCSASALATSMDPPPIWNINDSIFSSSSIVENQDILQAALDRINPVIVVIASSTGGGGGGGGESKLPPVKGRASLHLHSGANVVKMVCPSLNVIRSHCRRLAKDIEDFHRVQLQEALSILIHRYGVTNIDDINSCTVLEWEKDIKAVLNGQGMLNDHSFYTIHGSYSLWQDIFTHMSDEYLLKTSIAKLPLTDLLEAFSIASTYDMPILLTKYTEALVSRVSLPSLLQVMACTVVGQSPPYRLNIELCLVCLDYIHADWVNIRKKLSSHQLFQVICAINNIIAIIYLKM